MLIRVRRPGDIDPCEITDEGLYLRRREFLRSAALAGGAVAFAAAGAPRASRAARLAPDDLVFAGRGGLSARITAMSRSSPWKMLNRSHCPSGDHRGALY